MRKVLVITYYFPPCTGAPSWRPYSWALNFSKHNLKPTVITRHWTGKESSWEDFLSDNKSAPSYSSNEHFDVYYLPSKRYKFNDLLVRYRWARFVFGNLYFLFLAAKGRFNTEVDGWLSFNKHLELQLSSSTYDAVIISSPPSNILQLVNIVKRKSDAVIIADIRDLWNNLMLSVPYKPGLKQRVWDFFYASYYKKWLQKVDLITVIVEPFAEFLSKITKTPVRVVYNGYESSIFNTLGKRNSDQFIFSVVGSIYPEQDISIMLNGLKNFLLDKSPDKVAVRFIGAAAIHSVAEKIQEAIPSDFLHISGRVPKQDALQETIDAHVLSYSGWAGVRGIISTKAFDYIASGNYVLIAPGDNDALDKLIQECKCGSSVNSAVEFENVLEKLYQSWLKEGKLPYLGDRDKIEFYSREHQAKRLAEMIVELIDNKSNSK